MALDFTVDARCGMARTGTVSTARGTFRTPCFMPVGTRGAVRTLSSADLEDLGAIKVRGPGGETVYAIPELPSEQRAPEDHLRRVFSEWVVEVAHSANLVVLRTPPGSAHVVASALDRTGLPGVLGTVAGDDTIMVVVTEDTSGADIARGFSELAGL